MRSSSSPSCSNSSSNYSLSATSLRKRQETVFKKAKELSILCEIEMCVIHYGPNGEVETWPKERKKAEDIALTYIQLSKAQRRKKSVNLYGFLKKKKKASFMKTKKNSVSDPDQVSQLILSFQQIYSTLQERLRFVEEKKTNLDHHNLTHQPLENPSQFSLFMYNHGDATLSQIPLSALNFTDYSESGLLNNPLLYGCDEKSNFQQQLCVSNTQDHSALQETVNHYGLDQLMQQELFYGYDHNMWTSDITNSNFVDPCLSNTVFQNPYGNMVGNTSFPQDFPVMSSSYYESSQLETSTLPSLSTIPSSLLKFSLKRGEVVVQRE